MINANNESSINVSAGCNIEKAVDIINTVDGVNVTVENDSESAISPSDIVMAAKDISDAMKQSNNDSIGISDSVNANVSDSDSDYDSEQKIIECKNMCITESEWKKRNSNGGKKAGANNKKRRTAKDILQDLLQAELHKDSVDEILGESAQILGEDKTVYAVMCAKMIQIACAGDIKAFVAIRDTVGDKPADEHHLLADIMTDDDRRMIENMKKRMDKEALKLE